MMFVRVRQTFFPVDAIDQIDDIGGRIRVSLATGVKIDLDPVEGEKVIRQVSGNAVPAVSVPQSDHSAVISLMARVAALEAKVASTRDVPAKAKAKANA
jgi:hypothetical protein